MNEENRTKINNRKQSYYAKQQKKKVAFQRSMIKANKDKIGRGNQHA